MNQPVEKVNDKTTIQNNTLSISQDNPSINIAIQEIKIVNSLSNMLQP